MSKELSPLEALKQFRSQQLGVNVHADELLDIIEKALKALAIIKKRECLFKGLSETTQEEFDLLKEVLEIE